MNEPRMTMTEAEFRTRLEQAHIDGSLDTFDVLTRVIAELRAKVAAERGSQA